MEAYSFQAYGFKIEGHADEQRICAPSFKRFVKQKPDAGNFTIEQIIADSNIAKSLTYK